MTQYRFSPRSMRILAHVHHECSQHGWFRPIAEVAESIGESMETVRHLVTLRGWSGRFQPAPRTENASFGSLIRVMDDELEAMDAR